MTDHHPHPADHDDSNRESDDDTASHPMRGFGWGTTIGVCLAVVLFAGALLVAARHHSGGSSGSSLAGEKTPPGSSATGTAAPSSTASTSSSASSSADSTDVSVALPNQLLFTFRAGTEGWTPGNWQKHPGAVSATKQFGTDGTSSLHVVSNGAWFRGPLDVPVDMSAAHYLSFDVHGNGTNVIVAIQVGPKQKWCEMRGPRAKAGTVRVSVDLSHAPCTRSEQQDVRAVDIWLDAGTDDLDAVRLRT